MLKGNSKTKFKHHLDVLSVVFLFSVQKWLGSLCWSLLLLQYNWNNMEQSWGITLIIVDFRGFFFSCIYYNRPYMIKIKTNMLKSSLNWQILNFSFKRHETDCAIQINGHMGHFLTNRAFLILFLKS